MKRLNYNMVKSEIEATDEYILLSNTYKNNTTKLSIQHKQCNYIFEMDYDHWKRGQRCPLCNKISQKKKPEDFKKELEEKQPGHYEILSEYTNNKTKIKVRCLKCDSVFETLPGYLLNGNCRKCGTIRRSENQIKNIEEANKTLPSEYKIIDEYHGNKTPVKIMHTKCKKIFLATTTNIRGGSRCPYCYSSSSVAEKEVNEFIKSLNFNIEKYKLDIDKKAHKFLEADIFVPEKNIGFEYDGLYWHCDKNKSNNYHINKTESFYKNNIRLIHIFSDEWENKQEIVKDKIKSILGVQKEKIYARNCIFKEVSSKQRNKFLEDNHIQGADRASISYGLFLNSELVAVMSLSSLRLALGQKQQKDGVFELSRYAGKLGYTIVGGFSKLLKNIIKIHPEIKSILTYADLRWTGMSNNVYEKNGFILDHISKPSYYYTRDYKIREYRFKYRKDKLKTLFPEIYSDIKSEKDIMNEAGYSRIYDCGNLVYTMQIK